MEKVHLYVVYQEEGKHVEYAVMFTGVIRGENIYAKRTSPAGYNRPKEDYVKVKTSEVKNCNYKTGWNDKELVVLPDVGLNDPRITSMTPDQLLENLRKELDFLAEKCWE